MGPRARLAEHHTAVYDPDPTDVIDAVMAHHRRRAEPQPPAQSPTLGYRQESLDVLFGRDKP